MSATGLEVFDKTVQTTNIWLNELMEEIGPDRQLAWHVLGVVLRAIRDRIPLELAVKLGSQLPMLLRGLYFDQWASPGRLDGKAGSLDEFLGQVSEQMQNTRPVNMRNATSAVFGVLSRHINRGLVEHVRQAMPEQVRNIWHIDSLASGTQHTDLSARDPRL